MPAKVIVAAGIFTHGITGMRLGIVTVSETFGFCRIWRTFHADLSDADVELAFVDDVDDARGARLVLGRDHAQHGKQLVADFVPHLVGRNLCHLFPRYFGYRYVQLDGRRGRFA